MTPTNHDSTKVLLGSTGSNVRDVSYEPGDPAVCKAGLVVTRGSDGALDLGGAAGSMLGVSAGKSLSDTEKCAVVRTGLRVPIRLKDDNVFAAITKGDLTFTSKLRGVAGNAITITFADGGTAGSETVAVDGTDIVVTGDSETSTAQEIADALEASEEAMALIGVAIAEGEESTAQTAFAEDALEGGTDAFAWVEIGAAVEIDGTTGEATDDDVATSGVYASGVLSGVDPLTGAVECYAALVDMPGGL